MITFHYIYIFEHYRKIVLCWCCAKIYWKISLYELVLEYSMIQTLLLCAVVGCAIAVPSGTYHQEYSYKSSSSSFKNNELQHKTDDQGYYKKDGDLEGRMKPRVDANSEHAEYVNPNLRGSQYGVYDGNTDMTSHGVMNAESGVSSYGANNLGESLASSDRIVGIRGYTGSGSYGTNNYGSSNYGVGSYDSSRYGSSGYTSGTQGSSGYHTGSYGSTASIQSIIQRMQQDFERELRDQRWRQGYSQAIDQSDLESQFRRNLTERLNSELLNQYGQQTIRNGMAYSITNGRIQSSANYDNQELANLKQQMENNLLNSLRRQYSQGYGTSGSSSHYQSHSQSQSNYGYTSSTIRPAYQTLYPSLPIYSTTQRSSYTSSHSNYEVINSNVRYTPVVNPESVSTIASSVQSQLDAQLNQVLDDIYRKYFSSSTNYQLTNYDVVLNRLQNDLRNNVTYLIDDSLRRNYGSQLQRDGYYYSIGPSGQISSDYNYASRDLEQLKSQVERNLIEKLNRQFNTYRTRYTSQSHSFSSQSNYDSSNQYVTTPRYYYTTPRAQYISGGAHDQYSGYSGSSYGGSSSYSSGTYSSANMGQLQRQLQDELSRQLQAAISKDYSSHSSSGVYSPQNYQSSLQHLTDELNRNVTRHLQEYSGSASYSASGNYDQAQIDNIRSELLSSLTRQLQQNLQQHFQSSGSYSSSGSSNYRPVRGFQNYQQGQYRSGGSVTIGEDCDHDEIKGFRMKRSSYTPYRSHAQSYYHSSGYSHSSARNYGYSGSYKTPSVPQYPSYVETGQEVDNSDIGQQEELGQEVEEVESIPSLSGQPKPQKIQEDNGQQVVEEFDNLHVGQQDQQVDAGQQIVEEEFGNLHVGQQNGIGQQVDDSELTQQIEVVEPQKFINPSSQYETGQQVDETDLEVGASVYNRPTSDVQSEIPHSHPQQVQNSNYNKLHIGQQFQKPFSTYHHQVGQQVDDSKISQQTEEFGSLQVGQQVEPDHIGQVIESELSPVHYENVYVDTVHNYRTDQTPSHQITAGANVKPKPNEVGQQLDNSDLTQQTEELEPLQTGQEVDNSDLFPYQTGNLQETQNHRPGFSGIPSQGLDNSRKPQQELYPLHSQPTHYQQVVPAVDGIDVRNEVGQQLENAELSQHTEEFEPLQTGQTVDDTDAFQSHTGNFLLTQNHQPRDNGVTADVFGNSHTQQEIQDNVGQVTLNVALSQNHQPSISTANQIHLTSAQPENNQRDSSDYWRIYKWKPSQKIFIEMVKNSVIAKLEKTLKNTQISGSRKDISSYELQTMLKEEINSYNGYYLKNYLELKTEEIEGLTSFLSADLLHYYNEKLNRNSQTESQPQKPQTHYVPNVNNEETRFTNLEQHPVRQQTSTEGANVNSQNQITTGGVPQQTIEQVPQNQYVNPPSEQKPYEQSHSVRTYSGIVPNNQRPIFDYSGHYTGSQQSSIHGSTYQHPYRKPSRLPDSHAFINTEINAQRNNQFGSSMFYSSTLKKVLEEEHAKSTAGFENNTPPTVAQNQPQEIAQQESANNLQSGGIGRVSLEKSTGQWYGLSREGQILTGQQTLTDAENNADNLLEKLRQKQSHPNKPQVKVIEELPDQTNIPGNLDTAQHFGYGSLQETGYDSHRTVYGSMGTSYGSTPFNQRTGYNSFGSGPSLTSNERIYNQGKLNYGNQEEIQQNFKTTGNLETVGSAQANVVTQRKPQTPSNSYLGVKGHLHPVLPAQVVSSSEIPGLILVPSSSSLQPELTSELHEETTVSAPNEQDLPWWKRFGNKIKQGASDLKKKIVG